MDTEAWPLDHGSWLDAGGRWLLVGVMHAGLVGSLLELLGRRWAKGADLLDVCVELDGW
ncbi:hypothetical protein ACLOJK_026967, partial [Asimina triloba]